MSDIRDAGTRLRQMNDVLEENERLRGRLAWTERERDSLRKSIQNLRDYVVEQNCEIELLRSENPSTRRIASEFLRRPYCGQDCVDSKNDAIGPQSAAKTDTTQPRNGALSGVPDPDSRAWETPCTPQPHATPTQGSVQVRDSRNAIEPVAWAVEAGGELEASFCGRTGLEDAADWREQSDGTIVPLYRQPQTCPHVRGNVTHYCSLNFTLTDEEREAVVRALEYVAAAEWEWGSKRDAETAATLRRLLERLA